MIAVCHRTPRPKGQSDRHAPQTDLLRAIHPAPYIQPGRGRAPLQQQYVGLGTLPSEECNRAPCTAYARPAQVRPFGSL
ncbi:hypothetical protein L227DRAFT_323076 [Lentinus tigrinus ALCF2SS1-6]|uniref:Uncharacterized protein n=1 Tax=Lentinus tigrinus ALCF2SS1-6 TaxID=1328759 RepID=A0A5C2SK60_9APHY|nr:hypothetical protein L227DRAFT_323076 [Lentinus tigrinus ALCF2SS1-6]